MCNHSRTLWALVALAAVVVLLSPASGQFRPPRGNPPQPNPGIPPVPTPGAGISGIPGAPGGVSGIPGGGFQPGFPNGGFPNGGFPKMPDIQVPVIVTVWTCTKCGKEVGRGDFPPEKCPHCGIHFINGVKPLGGQLEMPQVPQLPTAGGSPPIFPIGPGAQPADNPFVKGNNGNDNSNLALRLFTIIGGIIAIAAIVTTSVVLANRVQSKPRRRKRKHLDYDDMTPISDM